VKLLVCLWVLLLQLVGPWLCCFNAQLVGLKLRTNEQAASQPIKSCPHCPDCCEEDDSEPAPCQDHEQPSRCPCQGVELLAVVDVFKHSGLQLDIELDAPPYLHWSCPSHQKLIAAIHAPLRTVPWMTVYDKLFSHHNLRC
jgi:hypothetical protein